VWLQLYGNRDGRYLDATGQPTRNVHYLSLVARLAPGATLEAARGQLAAIATAREVAFPDTNGGWRVTARPLHEQAVGSMRPALVTLAAGVGIVLLITCINIANVLLARATGRQRDLAIRSALGASGGRLIQQALVESLLLAIAGGALGLGLMVIGVQAILAVAPVTLTRIAEVSPNLTVALFAGVASILTGLAVGALPALSAARAHAQDALRETHRVTASPIRRRLRAGLIVAEVAMAMALTVGAGLLLRSFVAVLGVQPGFRPDHLLTLQVSVPSRVQPGAARLTFYDDLEARLKALPGVSAVGGTTRLPLGSTNVSTYVEVEGRGTPRAEWPEVELRRAVFDFFGAMNIPLVEGRTFTADDGPTVPSVLIVNTAFAARVFPGESALGKRVRFSGTQDGPWSTIVGVVGSVKHASLEETPKPELYIWYRQGPPVLPFLAIRTSGDPSAVATSVRDVIRGVGADPPTEVRTMAEIRRASMGPRRFMLLLVGLFGVLALTLAVVGVYGVITLVAAERTTEVGIRLALGSTPGQVMRLVVGHALKLALIGIVAGGALALAFAPALASQLFGIGSADPITYIGVAVTLTLISTLAALVPARRAMRIDPAATLRT
jgi:predicted permease